MSGDNASQKYSRKYKIAIDVVLKKNHNDFIKYLSLILDFIHLTNRSESFGCNYISAMSLIGNHSKI